MCEIRGTARGGSKASDPDSHLARGAHGKNPSTAPPQSEPTKERVPPFAPSGKLVSQELADPAGGSSFTQKRRRSSQPADSRGEATPGGDEAAARKTHKTSPLAEVEFADTRKPITRADSC
uniref:Uncharacterized protein n=1 Tax=Oryza punctata TaxID=4537 RepID=A0A0E0LPR3_ORYPU